MFAALVLSPFRWRRLLLAVLVMGLTVASRAADISVHASLERGLSVIGDPVQFEIRITGAQQMPDHPDIAVDGLEIQYIGRNMQQSFGMTNGLRMTASRTLIFVYQVVPQKNGSFTIPRVEMQIDGQRYKTEPVTLKVQPSSVTEGEVDTSKLVFAEFSVPKKSLYLGEAMPIELRYYIDPQVRGGYPETMPSISGEGLTMQKIPNPAEEDVERDGRDYKMVRFKTVVAPIRAGKLTIEPTVMNARVQVPRAQRSGPRNPIDFLDDMMSSPAFAAVRSLTVKAEAVELNVKNLPVANRPESFEGAVGTFQFSAEGAPKQVKIGDPVTMKLSIKGRGNFDRVTVPVLADSAGWRTYPPSTTFAPDDPVNFTGTKTFEIAVIPETKKSTMPVFEFSYFDPGTEKYVTLKSGGAPLLVEGDVLPPPPPVSTTGDATQPPPPEPKPDDIVGPRYELDSPRSFVPLYEHREFWFAQGAVGLVLLIFTALRLRRRPDAAVLQREALRQEKEAAWRRLRLPDVSHSDFLDAAARVAQIETALATGRAVSGIDASIVRSFAKLDDVDAETIESIFNSRAELHYAGGGGGSGQVSGSERERVLAVLRQLEKGHAKS